MLVLTRKQYEEVVIGGDKVRLGIQAPKEVPVHRREVYEAIANQEKES